MKNLLLMALLTLLFAPSCTDGAVIENPPITYPLSEPVRPYFDVLPKESEYELKSTAEGRAASHLYLIRELEKRNLELEIRIMILEQKFQDMRDGSNIPNRERNKDDI